MDPADTIIGTAKAALARGDHAGAVAALQALAPRALPPLTAVRALVTESTGLIALGRNAEASARQREALSILAESGVLTGEAPRPDLLRLALHLAVGAEDAEAVARYYPLLPSQTPRAAGPYAVSPMVGMEAWCRGNGIALHVMDPTETIAVPNGAVPGQAISYVSQSTWYVDIPGAEIVAGWDFPLSAAREVLVGSNYQPFEIAFPFMPHAFNGPMRRIAHLWPAESAFIDADALFLSTPERHHYGHWLVDFLPRLRAWDRSERPRRKLVISAALPAKHREVLAAFGVTDADVIACDLGKRYRFRSLRVVRAGEAVAPNPYNARFLYDTLRPAPDSRPPPGEGLRVFLVREAGTRLPANRAEVDAVFEAFGVIKVNPARISLAEQRALFARTEVMIGAFGTELYGVFNLHPGSTVIELIWDPRDARVFGPTSNFLGMDHHLIVCRRAEAGGHTNYKVDGDLIVDCEALRARLQAVVSRAKP